MKKLDQFILKAFIGPFIAILLVVIFVLMMQFLWVYIDELVGKGLGLKVILEFMFWGSCTTMPLCLPLATLLASMMTVGQMGENNELMAIKASGISLSRVFLPLFAAAVVISVGAFFVCNNLVPKAYNEIYTLRDDIGKTKNEIKIPAGTFYDGIDGYILRIGSQDKESRMMYHVMVYDHTSNKGNTSLTLADSAMMKMSKAKDYLTFTLYSGANYSENNNRKYRDTTWMLQHIDFKKQELVIPLKNYSFEKSDSSRFGDQANSMNIAKLAVERDTLRTQSAEAHERHYYSVRKASYFTFKGQLDTASRDGVDARVDYSSDEFLKWKDLKKEIRAYERAKSSASRMASDLKSKGSEVHDYYTRLRRIDIAYLKKFAQALACLLLFFIGAPLGALIRKGGLGASAIVSALFFVLYWVVDISGTKVAREGAAGAALGVFLSAYILAPIGAFLTYKSIKDATLFDSDRIATWWRKVKSLVERFFRQKRIVFMGTPEFAVASLDALVKARYKVVGVVTVADKPMGRGLKVQESAVKKYAVEHDIPVLQPLKLKDPEFLEALAAWKADLFVVVAFRMLPEEVWAMPKLGTFNLHAALLPQYRGAAPINWAVINGENISGVTTFMIDKKIDTGGIILRSECHIEPTDTAGDLHDKLMELGSTLVTETVEGLVQHNVELRVQRSFIQGSELLKPAPKLTRELQHIDWNDTTRHIYNLIRGLSPFPCAFTELVATGDEPIQLKVFFGEMRYDLPAAAPGTILSDGKTYFAVATQDGAIAITDLQLAGKKRMDVKSFLLGFRNPTSYTTTQGTSTLELAKAKPVEEY